MRPWLPILLFALMSPASAVCFAEAGARYGVSPLLLKAIQMQENSRGNPRLVTKNSNGTEDFGLMGINSIWLQHLKKYEITRDHLLDPCVNVMVGAWILSNHITRHGFTWESVGMYHSRTPALRDGYANRIKQRLVALGWENHGS